VFREDANPVAKNILYHSIYFFSRVHPAAVELGYIAEVLQQADVGALHLPVGVTTVEATDLSDVEVEDEFEDHDPDTAPG
jgi:hypothetical protein